MIPKRMFFYWSGNNLSWMRYMTLYSFRKFNSDWEIILYLSNNNNTTKTWSGVEQQDFLNYNGKNYLDEVEKLNIKIEDVVLPDDIKNNFPNISPIHESDIFRYYQLHKSGGFYCDMDVLFFESMDDFYNNIVKNDIDLLIHQNKMYLTIGFLGSSEGNEYYKDIFDFAIKNFNMDDYQSLGVDTIYKMYGGSRQRPIVIDKIISRYPTSNIYNLSDSLIYHFDWTHIEYNFNNRVGIDNYPDESIGYHWFGGSKISQHYNNIMNENNYDDYDTTFSEITKKIINK